MKPWTIPIYAMAKSSDTENSHVAIYFQETEFDQEFKELISTLPLEKGWITSLASISRILAFQRDCPRYNTLSFHKHFQALETDIFIITTPKSAPLGSKHWFCFAAKSIRILITITYIFAHYQPSYSYSLYGVWYLLWQRFCS